jgi:hypothetical protein
MVGHLAAQCGIPAIDPPGMFIEKFSLSPVVIFRHPARLAAPGRLHGHTFAEADPWLARIHW